MDAYHRRGFLKLTGSMAASAAVVGACGTRTTPTDPDAGGTVKIGLLGFQEGVFKVLGDDQRKGFELYLTLNDGKLGGRQVKVIEAEESVDDKATLRNAIRLIEQEQVTAIVGVTFSSNLVPIIPICQQAKVPLISPYATTLQAQGKDYIWRTSGLSGYDGYAIAEYVSEQHKGEGVYILSSDYAAGWDEVVGFKTRFTGEIAGEEYVPFPNTTDFTPFLSRIKESGAGALFCFLPADIGVNFIKQFHKYGLHGKIAFYGAEGMTELPFLADEGNTASGLMDAFYYSEVLDNAANRTFVSEYQRAYRQRPWALPLVAYDAAAVLDIAIASAGRGLTSERLEQEIHNIGIIESPRGMWRFAKNRAPVQPYHLRQVRPDGGVLANVVLELLGSYGDLPLSPATGPGR
ncbi:MAG: ABC transporter substrate-binding protein [Micromonosporaceae bacterium]